MTDNVVYVVKRTIKHHKIKVTFKGIKEYLYSHPDFPSLKSVCDAFNHWNVENYPLKLDINEIQKIECPFIAHLKDGGGTLAFVENIDNNHILYSINKKTKNNTDFDDFREKFTGAVILINPDDASGERNYLKIKQDLILSKALLPAVIITFLFVAANNLLFKFDFQTSKSMAILCLTKLCGFALSLVLLFHELKIRTKLSDRLCNLGTNISCDTVLASDSSKLFGWITWADTGIVYFASTLLLLIGVTSLQDLNILSILSTLTLPYVVFSIAFQSFKLKKWCLFCLFVQLIFLIEFFALLPYLSITGISLENLFELVLAFLLSISVYLLWKAYSINKKDNEQNKFRLNKFIRSADIFKYQLTKTTSLKCTIKDSLLIFGNEDAQITITAFLSMFCNHCVLALKELKEVLSINKKLRIVIILSAPQNDEIIKLIGYTHSIYKQSGQNTALDFMIIWYSLDSHARNKLLGNIEIQDWEIAQRIAEDNNEQFLKNNITGTPTLFINGFKLPDYYQIQDIEYIADNLHVDFDIHIDTKAGSLH